MLGLPQRKTALARGDNDAIRMTQDWIVAMAAHLMPTRWILACFAALFVAAPASAQMVEARDLAADARLAAEHKIPLLVLFSEAGCPYCERARLEFLLPMQRNPEYRGKVMYDLGDAWYLPNQGIGRVTRPGPEIRIFRKGKR